MIVTRLKPPASTGLILNKKRKIAIINTPPPIPAILPIIPTASAVMNSKNSSSEISIDLFLLVILKTLFIIATFFFGASDISDEDEWLEICRDLSGHFSLK
jgi:hypothetical protein